MRDVAELVAGWIYGIQITSAEQWLLRGLVLLAGVGVTLLSWWWFPTLAVPPLLASAAVLVLWSVVRPGSLAPLLLVVILALWWLAGAGGALGWQWLVIAGLVGLFHMASAHAAAAPSWAAVRRGAASVMARTSALHLGASLVVGALVLVVVRTPSDALARGPWWLVAGLVALALVVVAVVHGLRRIR